jgi:site-specific recombinase XerD
MITSDLKNQFVFEKPKPADFLFPSHSKYGRLTRHGARYKVKQWEKIVGRPLHPHMWCHSLAVHLLSHGVNVFTTMNNYLVITPELQREMTEHVPMR